MQKVTKLMIMIKRNQVYEMAQQKASSQKI